MGRIFRLDDAFSGILQLKETPCNTSRSATKKYRKDKKGNGWEVWGGKGIAIFDAIEIIDIAW